MPESGHWEDDGRCKELVARALAKLPSDHRDWCGIRTSCGVIDHLIVGPTGVWLIAAAPADPPISVRHGQLLRGEVDAQDLIDSVERQAAIAAAYVGLPVRPILAVPGLVVGDARLMVSQVRLAPATKVVDYITNAPSEMPPERLFETRYRVDIWQGESNSLVMRASAAEPTRQPSAPVAAPTRKLTVNRAVEMALFLAIIGVLLWVSVDGTRRQHVATWATDPVGAVLGESTSRSGEISDPGLPDLGPVEGDFVCSETTGSYWLQISVTDFDAGKTHLAVSLDGVERYLGEFGTFEPIEAVAGIAPGAPITLAVRWQPSSASAPQDLKRAFRAPSDPCPSE
ncbi:MAG: NERD domain-containing protein [Actinobacteria bacterium]|nr:NERD domain-containing protein [Actinomycetota bacterium]